jgi:hypothetical protein
MERNLSPSLQAFMAVVDENDGFYLKDLPAGTMIELTTQSGSLYTMVVIDPEGGELALFGGGHPKTQQPEIYILQGSTCGGSACKVGWIGLNLRLRLNLLSGGLIVLSSLKAFEIKTDEIQACNIIAEAESRRPLEATDEELAEMQVQIDCLVDEKFDGDEREQVRDMTHRFNLEGQGMMLGYFDRAQEAGKLEAALEVMERHYREHWSFRPQVARGSFITPEDIRYMKLAYTEIGLTPPQ